MTFSITWELNLPVACWARAFSMSLRCCSYFFVSPLSASRSSVFSMVLACSVWGRPAPPRSGVSARGQRLIVEPGGHVNHSGGRREPSSEVAVRRVAVAREVLEQDVLSDERQLHGADGPASLLGDDD